MLTIAERKWSSFFREISELGCLEFVGITILYYFYVFT